MKRIFAVLLALCISLGTMAQQKLTREQILAMSTEELSELPLEDLMQAVETLGVASVDELFALIMNKNVSSASKEEESSFTSPLASTVITRDEMRTYGVTTMEEALRLIPGMIVTEKTNGVYDVQIRGLNNIPDNNMLLYTENSNTLVMIDGRPVHNYAMGAVTFEMYPIDIEDVERIEVVRGASGALYGANAVTGVINIITTKPDASKATVSGSVQMGNYNTVVGNAALRKSVSDKFAFGLTFNMQHRNRPTSDIYVMPNSQLVYASDESLTGGTMLTQEALGQAMQSGSLSSFAEGGYLGVEKLENLRQLFPTTGQGGKLTGYTLYNILEPETPATEMFKDPSLARRSTGVNGYVAITPAKDIRFDISGGYQQSYVNTTQMGDDYFSYNGREVKNGYVALAAQVKGLNLLVNYSGGPADYAVGVPGFKISTNHFNASAEYDFYIGDLNIRPGVFYQRVYYKDYVPDYDDRNEDGTLSSYKWSYRGTDYRYPSDPQDPAYNYPHLSGFFNYDAEMTAVAPSVRLDYKIGKFRLIGAYRADKTNIPDKWNQSWQFSASCSINDSNFLRLSYGRANRSAVMVNSNSNFTWTRTGLSSPTQLIYLNNKDADLMSIDNFEIGYRVKPSNRLLIDAEAFYSRSRDYGAMMANESLVTISYDKAQYYVSSYFADVSRISRDIESICTAQYRNLPYEVSQFGVSVNVDWIISPKLIAKLNCNVQKTTIDDYFPYSQETNFKSMSQNSSSRLQSTITQLVMQMQGMNPAEKADAIDKYMTKYLTKNDDKQRFEMASTVADDPRLQAKYQDGFENKATPRFYGMLGLVYKPIQQVNISAFANYIGKRSYVTNHSSNYVEFGEGEDVSYNENGTDLSQRLTINLHAGYKPVDNCEIFVNAHNLLNNQKREFVYCDEIGGLYTVGVNFEF